MKKIFNSFLNRLKTPSQASGAAVQRDALPEERGQGERAGDEWKEEMVEMPERYIVTQNGQMMRDPVKRKIYFKRYPVKK